MAVELLDENIKKESFKAKNLKLVLNEYRKNRTRLKISHREAVVDETVDYYGIISSFQIDQDNKEHRITIILKSKKEIVAYIPNNSTIHKIYRKDGTLYVCDVRWDNDIILLGLGFMLNDK